MLKKSSYSIAQHGTNILFDAMFKRHLGLLGNLKSLFCLFCLSVVMLLSVLFSSTTWAEGNTSSNLITSTSLVDDIASTNPNNNIKNQNNNNNNQDSSRTSSNSHDMSNPNSADYSNSNLNTHSSVQTKPLNSELNNNYSDANQSAKKVVPLSHGLMLALTIFMIGFCGVMVRKNLFFVLLSTQLMILGAGLGFVCAGSRWGSADGQGMYFFIVIFSVVQAIIGLSILIKFYHLYGHLQVDDADMATTKNNSETTSTMALAHQRNADEMPNIISSVGAASSSMTASNTTSSGVQNIPTVQSNTTVQSASDKTTIVNTIDDKE